jgi:hypothetical protein
MRALAFAIGAICLLSAGAAGAVLLAPGDNVAPTAASLGSRTTLLGPVAVPYEIPDAGMPPATLASGAVDVTVSQLDDGRLAFEYAFANDPGSTLGIQILQLLDFPGYTVDAGYDITVDGHIPNAVSRSSNGAGFAVAFWFSTTPVLAGDETKTLHIVTNAEAYDSFGTLRIGAGATTVDVGGVPRPVPEPARGAAVAAAAALAAAAARRSALRR